MRSARIGTDSHHFVLISTLDPLAQKAAEAEHYVANYEQQHGPDAVVFVASKISWSGWEGNLSFRDFSVLCGINSASGIQRTAPILISSIMIAARAPGYPPHIMNERDAEPLTTRQLQTPWIGWSLDTDC